MELVRIIAVDDFLNYILPQNGERSSFIFRDPRSYRDVSLQNGGDPKEQETSVENFTATTQNNFLVSCWHCLEDSSNVAEFFDIHEEGKKIAVVSTVEAVEKIVKDLSINYMEKGLVQDFKHRKIHYYDYEKIVKPSDKNLPDYCLDALFRKPRIYNQKNYEKEKEYRFAYRISSYAQIERIVFYVNPSSYIKRIYLNSDLKDFVHRVGSRLKCWDIKFSDSTTGQFTEIVALEP